jgi:hypothetical protein
MGKRAMRIRMASGMEASGLMIEAPYCCFRSFRARRGGESPWEAMNIAIDEWSNKRYVA